MKHIFRVVFFSCVVCLMGRGSFTPMLLAQSTATATIRGMVTDTSGAIIPGAQVTVTNQDTKVVVFKGNTTSDGGFVLPQVQTGTYSISAEAPGMKRTTVSNVTASIAQTVTVDLKMELGEVQQEVIVNSRGEALEKSTSDVSTLIAPSDVQNLPLQSRDVVNLLTLIPGVAHGGSATSLNSAQLSINGSRTLNNEILLNGVSIVIASTGGLERLPSPDGINEFRVLTTNASAEYGRTSGAVLSADIRSGTSQYHGNIYTLVRNEALNANTFFNNLKGLPRGADRYYQFGGSLGGPLAIPRLYSRSHKTFFFFNYDYTLNKAPSTSSFTVPTNDFRAGDFSAAHTPVYKPGTHTPYPGNKITDPLDPAAVAILARMPQPNNPGTYDAANSRYTGNYVQTDVRDIKTLRTVGRLDQQVGAKGQFNTSVYRTTMQTPQVINFHDPILNDGYDCNCLDGWVASVSYTHTFTPTLIANINFGFFRDGAIRNPTSAGKDISKTIGIASLPLDQMPYLTEGYTAVGGAGNSTQQNITNTYTPFGSVTKLLGPHSVKIGFSLRKNEFNTYNPSAYVNGNLSFDGSITNATNSTGSAVNELADFLLGMPKTGSYQLAQPETGRRNFNLGIYAEDNWRVSPKLTLNLGVRWEYESPQTVAHNIYTRFDPKTGDFLIAGKNGVSSSLNVTTPKLDFSPRIGLAYSPNQNTVFRAAFGTFYGLIFANLGGQIGYPGFDVITNYNNLGTGVPQPFKLSQGFPLTGVQDLDHPENYLIGASPAKPVPISGFEFDKLSPLSLVQQWNAGVQQEMPLGITFELNYVGNHGLHLPYAVPVNVVDPAQATAVVAANNTVATQNAKPFPNLSTWTTVQNVGNSTYHSLQATVKRQFHSNFAVLANYTWAKAIDDGSTIYNYSAPHGTANVQYVADPIARRHDRGPSNYDVRHTVNIALQYTTGGNKWTRGFRISPVFVGHTGLPLNITQTTEFPNASNQRPNGDSSRVVLAHPYVDGKVVRYLQNPVGNSDFPLTPSGPVFFGSGASRKQYVATGFGNIGRDSIRAPGEVELDLSVSRTIQLYRRLSFQLRADAFNVLNHTNLGMPTTSLTVANVGTASAPRAGFNNSSFGQITSSQPPRIMQLVGRFSF
ncbi:MAG TPA: TonB-dependent receptor [Edaphobacter sp.]|nr:TonB-dependent receptor [Edaphobacter sp.]